MDRWALRAIGHADTTTEAELPTVSQPYHEAAFALGITAAQLQAATWAQIRREAQAAQLRAIQATTQRHNED